MIQISYSKKQWFDLSAFYTIVKAYKYHMQEHYMKSIWSTILSEAKQVAADEPALISHIHETVINQPDLAHAMAFHLAGKFQDSTISAVSYSHLFIDIMKSDPNIVKFVIADLEAIRERGKDSIRQDPAK